MPKAKRDHIIRINISAAERKALTILNGCPDGATTAALNENCGVAIETMADLIQAGLVTKQRQHIVALPKLVVIRLRITDKGREQLK